jgi:hypothetical protein
MCLQFGFVIFWQKDFGAKAAHKMLVKLTPACLVSPPALSACLFCFVPATSTCSSKWIFATATNNTINAKQDRQYV